MALDTTQPAQPQKSPHISHDSERKSKPTQKAAIRDKCAECLPESRADVRRCPFGPESHEPCPLYPFRLGRAPRGSGSRAKAIRAYCIWCMNGQNTLVRECDTDDCSLHPFRMGRRAR